MLRRSAAAQQVSSPVHHAFETRPLELQTRLLCERIVAASQRPVVVNGVIKQRATTACETRQEHLKKKHFKLDTGGPKELKEKRAMREPTWVIGAGEGAHARASTGKLGRIAGPRATEGGNKDGGAHH